MKTLVFLFAAVACAPAVAAAPNAAPSPSGLPTFVMWDVPATVTPGHLLVLGLPDTFVVRLRFTATTPVRTRIMTFDEYAHFRATGLADVPTYPPTTSLDVTFADSAACAIYMVVLDAERETTIAPNFTITRAGPQYALTGACAP